MTLLRLVADRIGYAHAVLAPKTKLLIQFRIGSREHAAIARREKFARMEREARHIAMRLADFFPTSIATNFTSHSARGILYYCQGISPGNVCNFLYVARHTYLVDTKDGACALSNDVLDQCRIHVESTGFDVDENRDCPTVANAVGAGDVRMADGNHLIAWLNPYG